MSAASGRRAGRHGGCLTEGMESEGVDDGLWDAK
jgi:hypothetical protein